jgi:hypothetical protein
MDGRTDGRAGVGVKWRGRESGGANSQMGFFAYLPRGRTGFGFAFGLRIATVFVGVAPCLAWCWYAVLLRL